MTRRDTGTTSGWAIGGTLLAAALMVLLGFWGILVGIAAIASDAVFVTPSDYTFDVDLAAWGWIHLILAIIAFLAGLALFTGATWARMIGIVLAIVVAIDYFLFLPFYPIWSIIVIALAVFVIWSLATVSRRAMTDYPTDESRPIRSEDVTGTRREEFIEPGRAGGPGDRRQRPVG